jgi:hypothetical protein
MMKYLCRGVPILPYPGYAIQIASYGMRYVGIFAERICVKHP